MLPEQERASTPPSSSVVFLPSLPLRKRDAAAVPMYICLSFSAPPEVRGQGCDLE